MRDFFFCGAKAWKAERLQTVQEVINDLFLINQAAKRIVNIRLTIEMHNLRGERFCNVHSLL